MLNKNSQFSIRHSTFRRGFAALSMVLMVSAVVLTIAGTVSYLSIGEAQTSIGLDLSENDLGLVDGCAEDVLQKIHDDSSYSATSIVRPEGTCSITYSLGGPTNWDVTVTASQNTYSRKVRVIFTRSSSSITVTSWQEI